MTALYRSRPILLTVAMLLLVLVLGASGCSSDEPATDTSGSDDAATDAARPRHDHTDDREQDVDHPPRAGPLAQYVDWHRQRRRQAR